jgi:hypothetical protein
MHFERMLKSAWIFLAPAAHWKTSGCSTSDQTGPGPGSAPQDLIQSPDTSEQLPSLLTG